LRIFTFLIVRSDGLAAIHVESAVAPTHYVFDNAISDFAFSFKHFEDFMAKQLFKNTLLLRDKGLKNCCWPMPSSAR
jgi:hypothetical protein